MGFYYWYSLFTAISQNITAWLFLSQSNCFLTEQKQNKTTAMNYE